MNKILKSIKLGNCAVEVGFVAAAVDALAENALVEGNVHEYADLVTAAAFLSGAGKTLEGTLERVTDEISNEETAPEAANV